MTCSARGKAAKAEMPLVDCCCMDPARPLGEAVQRGFVACSGRAKEAGAAKELSDMVRPRKRSGKQK